MDIFHLKFIHLALPNFKIKLIISIVLLNNIRATIALGLEGDANQSPAGIQVQVLKVPAALLLATVAGAYTGQVLGQVLGQSLPIRRQGQTVAIQYASTCMWTSATSADC